MSDLKQEDLSRLTIRQMSSEQRAEMRRRFEAFVEGLRTHQGPELPQGERGKVRKWVPGMKR